MADEMQEFIHRALQLVHFDFDLHHPYAQRVVAIRGNPMALCIPFTLFTLGCYYVLGSLEYLQGATPSERTFIGIIPMLTSTNLVIQLLRARRLKSRLQSAQVVA